MTAAATSSNGFSHPSVLVVAVALVSLLPLAFVSVTAYVKIATVLQIVRSAIGAQGIPSNTVITALAGALTLIVMAPVGDEIAARAAPLLERTEVLDVATVVRDGIDAVRSPMREFLVRNASAVERDRFLDVARGTRPEDQREQVRGDDLIVVAPAFLVTELSEAFSIGFLIFLPFVIIDLVVANVLLALGMQTMSPVHMSLPFKLLLFVAINGWGLLATSLVSGYRY